jgi:hypothetical protein
MVTVVKHEWHQHDRQYAIEIDEELLSEIYPELDEDEIKQKLAGLEEGDIGYEEVLDDANENDVDIEWEFQYDDCWTDRKGGYDVTYELGDSDSWHSEPEPPPHTHKCTKCKWVGQSYDAEWSWVDKDGTEIDDPRKICPMCESDTELTEAGIKDKKESDERDARWAKETVDDEEDDKPIDATELEAALEELKQEFETLVTESDVLPNYPAGEYTIRVWGRTREIGVHKIKKQQYDYWSDEDHEDDLSDALNENYDYDENGTPKAARFDLPYYEYQDKHSFWGFDQDDTRMTIENSEGETIYVGDLESFIAEAHGEEDSRWEATEEQEELYPEYLGKGYWLMWTQGGKGSCIQTTIEIPEGQEFDPRKLKVLNWDIQGTSVVTCLVYDGDELDDSGMDSEHDNWRGQWAQFDVYHNTK